MAVHLRKAASRQGGLAARAMAICRYRSYNRSLIICKVGMAHHFLLPYAGGQCSPYDT
jgi:hypothetical protein